MWATIDSSFVAEFIAMEKVDYVCCDQQHGVIDHREVFSMFQAILAGGSIPITRVVQNDPGAIMKSLDAGAAGVIVPMVSSKEDARRAGAAFRYSPRGTRSFGPIRASLITGSRNPEELADVACIVMVETVDGVARVDEIAGEPGIDAIYIGPADLSLALGLPPAFDQPAAAYRDALIKVLSACKRHGVIAGIHCTNGEMALSYADMGFRMVTVASDANLLRSAVRREMDICRPKKSDEIVGGYV